MNKIEIIVFMVYLVFMLGIGVFFFLKDKNGSEKTYFLGGRSMGPWVSALSAGASDMSAWVLMGLPASIYMYGIGKAWIAIGLAIGYALSWLLEAPRLRKFTIVCNDSITLPQYLANRFLSKSKTIRVLCAAIFLIAYTVYAASSMKACGTLFNTVLGIDTKLAMYLAAGVILLYTFLGGFKAVCWTDFFQGMLMLAALLAAPIFAVFVMKNSGSAGSMAQLGDNYWSLFANWKDIVSGLGWGIGYFGMPHIIVRFMSLESDKALKKSAKIGITWNVLIVLFSVAAGCIGHLLLGDIADSSTVFIQMTRKLFPAVISGIVLTAILAASMSTADSQLLASSSAFASDIYKPVLRKDKATDKEMLWAGRFVVLAISVVAVLIASNPNSGTIMGLVENAWGLFGAAFSAVIILSLFWKRFNIGGAIAGIVAGAVVDIAWLLMFNYSFVEGSVFGTAFEAMHTSVLGGIYEIIPGFAASLIAAVVVTLLTKNPSKEIEELYDRAVNYAD